MTDRQLKEKYNEGPEDHFEDPYEYARYLERTGQKHEALVIRRQLKREGKNE